MQLMIYFTNEQSAMPVTYKLKMLIRRSAEETLLYLGHNGPFEISVTLTDNEKIRELNRRFRGIDRATDVLSFPMIEVAGDSVDCSLGDIVISLERAREQAEEFGHSFEREAAYLTSHSVLHLLGYDHERSEEEDKLTRKLQRTIMERLGLSVGGTD